MHRHMVAKLKHLALLICALSQLTTHLAVTKRTSDKLQIYEEKIKKQMIITIRNKELNVVM